MEFKDYYATLGVAKDASEKDIKQAYRKLARKFHPDVNPGDKAAEARFKDINEAYEVVGNPANRRKYDELGANWRLYEQAPPGGPNPFQGGGWRVNVGGTPGGRTASDADLRDVFGEADPFSDFFRTFFGGQAPDATSSRPGRSPRNRRGRDLEHDLELTLEESLSGTTRRLSLKHDGHARSVDVRIPPGVADGSRVRVAGEGGHGLGAPAGDLYLRIRQAPHPRFERRGRDLHAKVAVPLTTAVLGGEADVTGLDGRTVRLRVPPTTQNGQVFRLKGHGMPAVGKADERGDLYITTEVRLPQRLTAEQRHLFEALARLEDGSECATRET